MAASAIGVSKDDISAVWEVYRGSLATLHSKTQSFMIGQAILILSFVILILFEGGQDPEIVIFVVSLQVAILGFYLAGGLTGSVQPLRARMERLRSEYLADWAPFGADSDEGTQSYNYSQVLAGAMMSFWPAAALASFILFLFAVDAFNIG